MGVIVRQLRMDKVAVPNQIAQASAAGDQPGVHPAESIFS